MTVEEVQQRVAEIHEMAENEDYEMAHSYEDDLYRDVLEAIAGGATNDFELARAALVTADIEFSHWCA